jgi:hypothetical protein
VSEPEAWLWIGLSVLLVTTWTVGTTLTAYALGVLP